MKQGSSPGLKDNETKTTKKQSEQKEEKAKKERKEKNQGKEGERKNHFTRQSRGHQAPSTNKSRGSFMHDCSSTGGSTRARKQYPANEKQEHKTGEWYFSAVLQIISLLILFLGIL